MSDAREYKRLLDPAAITAVNPEDANAFLDDRLAPIARALGIPVVERFDTRRKREIPFYDTAGRPSPAPASPFAAASRRTRSPRSP